MVLSQAQFALLEQAAGCTSGFLFRPTIFLLTDLPRLPFVSLPIVSTVPTTAPRRGCSLPRNCLETTRTLLLVHAADPIGGRRTVRALSDEPPAHKPKTSKQHCEQYPVGHR